MKKINIVLYQPEIAENAGNIMRSCVGFDAHLHLILPLGFNLYDKRIKRSAVNYLDHLEYTLYDDLDDFFKQNPNANIYYLTRYGHKTPKDIKIDSSSDEPIYFMFGRESTGIPYDLLNKNLDRCYRIPTTDKVRSLNLSNCVAIVLFEATSQNNYDGLFRDEPDTLKGHDFIDNYKDGE